MQTPCIYYAELYWASDQEGATWKVIRSSVSNVLTEEPLQAHLEKGSTGVYCKEGGFQAWIFKEKQNRSQFEGRRRWELDVSSNSSLRQTPGPLQF